MCIFFGKDASCHPKDIFSCIYAESEDFKTKSVCITLDVGNSKTFID